MLETSHPPTYYLPRERFADGVLRETSGTSWCPEPSLLRRGSLLLERRLHLVAVQEEVEDLR
jgi:Domain of unknown function (DUF427)